MTTVVTGFSPKGEVEYGKNFLKTFDKHWPKSVGLLCYTEQPVEMPRGECRSLFDCHGVESFLNRHKDNQVYSGRKEQADRPWKNKDRLNGYSFRYDATKFCRQLFIPEHAASAMQDGDILCWLDGDVVTFADVPENFIEDLLGRNELVYLGRGRKHSEIGFWAVRLNGFTRAFLSLLAEMYRGDGVFTLGEWHSAFVFDRVREKALRDRPTRDLSPGGDGHVWFQTPLGLYTDHLKGKRKAAGRSGERVHGRA